MLVFSLFNDKNCAFQMNRLLIYFILSFSFFCSFAKQKKIKVGKSIEYIGYVENKKPKGEGTMSIFDVSTNNPQIIIKGDFAGQTISNAVITLLFSNSTFSYPIVNYEITIQKGEEEIIRFQLVGSGVGLLEGKNYQIGEGLLSVSNRFKDKSYTIDCPSWKNVTWTNPYKSGPLVGTVETTADLKWNVYTHKYEFVGHNYHLDITDDNGNSYKGEYAINKVCKGEKRIHSGNFEQGYFRITQRNNISDWKLINGTCDIITEKGHYIGSIKDGEFEAGRLSLDSGEFYSGKWRNGTFWDGNCKTSRYTGTLKNGKYLEGLLQIDKKNFYKGKWDEDGNFWEGEVCIKDEENTQVGFIKKGKFWKGSTHGIINSKADIYNGVWDSGVFTGMCTINIDRDYSVVAKMVEGTVSSAQLELHHDGVSYSVNLTRENNYYNVNISQDYNDYLTTTIPNFNVQSNFFPVFVSLIENHKEEYENEQKRKENMNKVQIVKEYLSIQDEMRPYLQKSDFKNAIVTKTIWSLKKRYTHDASLNIGKDGAAWIDFGVFEDDYNPAKKCIVKLEDGSILQFLVRTSYRKSRESLSSTAVMAASAINPWLGLFATAADADMPNYVNMHCITPTLDQWNKVLSSPAVKMRLVYEDDKYVDCDINDSEMNVLNQLHDLIYKFLEHREKIDHPELDL